MSAAYNSLDQAYCDRQITYVDTEDYYPIEDWWREDPLSNRSYIRPNTAGYRPYPSYKLKYKSGQPTQSWDLAYSTVCSTIAPKNPQYTKDKTVILYR